MKRIPRGVSTCHAPLLIRQRQAWSQPHLHTAKGPTTRTVSRIARQAGHLDIQEVVVRHRWFTWKRFGTLTLCTAIGLTSAAWVLGYILLEEEEEEEEEDDDDDEVKGDTDMTLVANSVNELRHETKHGRQGDRLEGVGVGAERPDKHSTTARSKHEDEEEEDEEDDEDYIPDETPEGAWFIPLGRVQQREQTFYGASDPEWQEFVKLTKDKMRMERVRNELIDMVHTASMNDARVTRTLGKKLTLSGKWIYLDVPLGPPKTYEQLGIEWAPDYIAILYRPRDSVNVRRVSRALWPDVVAVSAFATMKDLVSRQVRKAKRAVGMEVESEVPAVRSLTTHVSLQAAENGLTGQDANKEAVLMKRSVRGLPDYPERDEDIAHGIDLFKRKLAKKWKGRPKETPPGSVILEGMVAFRSERGECTWYVLANYSVMDNRFTAVMATLRRVRPRIQRPRGP